MDKKASLLDPVSQPERITVIDALRGFAVFGMFIINARVFSGYSYISEEMKNDLPLAGLNSVFDWIHLVFFNGKFYTLFALLFGSRVCDTVCPRFKDRPTFYFAFQQTPFFPPADRSCPSLGDLVQRHTGAYMLSADICSSPSDGCQTGDCF
jgi:hypothetical protein